MGIDYSRQAGKKIITKGHIKNCIDIENIVYVLYNGGGLSTIYLNNKNKVNVIKTLTAFEEEFADMGFMRISRNTLINGRYITKINTNNGKKIIYLGEIELKISKRRAFLLKSLLF